MINKINNLKYQNKNNFLLIAGPCVIESEEISFQIAEKILMICDKLEIPFIFKGSYRKANRSKLESFTGIGDIEALSILKKIRKKYNIPVLTDIHSVNEIELAAKYVDILQIPAFLCRQTDLLVAAANSGKIINVKKGQFLSPESMKFAIEKISGSGNKSIIITDRGTMFGYNDIIVDFRGIPTMKKFGFPVIMDVTHSVQQPNQSTGITGGKPEMIETISKAAIATGADGIFIETHPNPSIAKSDGTNMLKLDKLKELLEKLVKIRKAI